MLHGAAVQTLCQLDRVKRQLKQPYASKETIAASISRLEHGLRKQAQVGARRPPGANMVHFTCKRMCWAWLLRLHFSYEQLLPSMCLCGGTQWRPDKAAV